jgi:hypothetical protein
MAIRPNKGPMERIRYIFFGSMTVRKALRISILIMVMKKPMELVIVKAVPFDAGGADCATKVEN